jgi:hypothetical protein
VSGEGRFSPRFGLLLTERRRVRVMLQYMLVEPDVRSAALAGVPAVTLSKPRWAHDWIALH